MGSTGVAGTYPVMPAVDSMTGRIFFSSAS